MGWLLALLFFFFLVTGTVQTVRTPPDPVVDRLSRMSSMTPLERLQMDGVQQEVDHSEEEEALAVKRRKDLMPNLTRLLKTQYWFERLDADLAAARSPWKAREILLACLFSYALAAMLGLWIFRTPFGFVISLPVFIVPWRLVKLFGGKFVRRFELQLADTLQMMADALRAGYSYMQTVELVAREALPPMGDEFKTMMQEMAVGITPEQSLVNFSDRVKSADVELMVTAVIIQRRVGGALAEILGTIATVIRDRVRLRGQISTLTAQGRITGTMLSLMPIGIGFAVTVITRLTGGMDYMGPLFHNTAGHYMILVALIMQIVGYISIRKITSIEV